MSSSRVVRVRPAEDGVAPQVLRDGIAEIQARARGESGVPAGGRGGRRGGGREPPAARPRPDRPADGDHRPGWREGPRPGAVPRADRRRRLRALLRDRRPRRVHHPRRPGRRGGAPARPDALRRGQPHPAAPDVDLRGRRLAAARPGPPVAAVDDHHGRGGRAHRRGGGAGAGEEPGPARLPRRPEADRRRHRGRVPDAPQGGRASSGSSASRPAAASRCRCPSRRSTRPGRSGSSPTATCCRSRSGTRRCRCSPASPRRR